MKKYLKQGWQLFYDSLRFFNKGRKENLLKEYLKTFLLTISTHLAKFHHHLSEMNVDQKEEFIKLQERVKGLHSLLPKSPQYSYSILINLENPNPKFLKSCLTSALMQTPPSFEILIGSKLVLKEEINKTLNDLKIQYPNKIIFIDFSHIKDENGVYNFLAEKSQGNFLLFIKQNDWIRPDLLYRYEQVLRTISQPGKTIVISAENQLNEKDHFIPGSFSKKIVPDFPFVFEISLDLSGMLIPRKLWNEVQGLRQELLGAEEEDLILRLNCAGAEFVNIPLPLYSRRMIPKGAKQDWNSTIFIHSLSQYAKNKELNWSFEPGYHCKNIRVIPKPIKEHKIQIIIPFKNQKALTLRCVNTLLKQKGVNLVITAVDNASEDLSIAVSIKGFGGEVLRIEEPFNYSRLNNLAVARSHLAKDCDLILFLNNDVELDENALLEMSRWIDQPSIGVVGARLHYSNGQLQHGGVYLNTDYLPEILWWNHKEKLKTFEEMEQTKSLAIVDAVTAACALIKKDIFLEIGGFNEVCYPISYSDTNLAVKLNQRGLKCLYTPYAFGIHHESISRRQAFEDFDSSRWLHELCLQSSNPNLAK